MKSEFGWIKVNGKKYEKDVIIHSDGSVTKREKKKSKDLKSTYGHTPLSEANWIFYRRKNSTLCTLELVIEAALPITPKALEILKKYNASILPTPEVIDEIKKEQRKFVAIIHVTC